jgi:hypothetical protein
MDYSWESERNKEVTSHSDPRRQNLERVEINKARGSPQINVAVATVCLRPLKIRVYLRLIIFS